MAYQMVATVVTLNDFEGHSSVAGLFKCNPSNIYAAFYTISTDSMLARFLCISRASCFGANVIFSQIKSATKFLYVKTSTGKIVIQPFLYLTFHER